MTPVKPITPTVAAPICRKLAWLPPTALAGLLLLPTASAQVLVPTGSTWRYFKGTQEASSPTNAWRQPGFNDAAWPSGPAPLRYGDGSGGTLLSDMQNGYSSVFLRQAFVVTNAAQMQNLRVTADYDDGFVLWLNGTEILRLNAPASLAYNALTPTDHESGTLETYTLTGAGAFLVNGTNVLAAQAFNVTLGSSDFMFDLRLEGTLPQPVLPGTKDTKFSVKRGFYTTNFTVVISSDTSEATITYTLDGSDPRTSATAQSGPTPVSVLIDPASTYGGRRPRLTPCVTLRAYASKPGRAPSNVDTQTYLFLSRVRTQGNIVPSGSYVFWDTVMDARVNNDSRYTNLFNLALQDIPTLSIVMDWEDLFGTGGIHRGNNLNNHALEKPCSIELIYPPGPKFTNYAGFQVRGGIKIQGGGGRWDEGRYDPKQSFTLLFQPQFEGPGRLKYPLFEAAPLNRDTDVAEYNRVILRAGHNKSWPGPGPNLRQTVVYTRDEYFRASHLAMSGKGMSAHGTFVHLYLNGLYWGLYNPVERPDHGFLSIHFGGDGEHYDCYKERNGDPNGDRNRLNAAKTAVASTTTPYTTVREYVDTAQFADFLIVTWSGGAADGPQWYAGNARNPPGPIRWFCWDYEDSFTPSGTGRGGAGYTWTEANTLWTSIRGHPEFKMELADRVYLHCFNDGVFTDTANTNRWLTLAAYIENAILGESARWGDQGVSSRGGPDISGYTPPLNRNDHWYNARNQVTGMLLGNTTKMINDLRARGYFPSANARAPLFYDGANNLIAVSRRVFTNTFSLRLARDGTTGTIYWTTNGLDPRAEGGAAQGLSGGTGTNLGLTGTTTVRARVLYGTEWSPVHVLTLHSISNHLDALKMTEIMYRPAGTELAAGRAVSQFIADAGGADAGRGLIRLAASAPGSPFGSGDEIVISGALAAQNNGRFTAERVSGRDVYLDQLLVDEAATGATAALSLTGDRYEFVELKNTGATPLNLSGARFTDGLKYDFPEGAVLGPGQFWVLTPHRSNFRDRQPAVSVRGFYLGRLDNGGERLTLVDYFGNLVTTVQYSDAAPWPASADGLGYSLVPVTPNPSGSQDTYLAWRASQNPGGSPGADDPVFTVPPIKVNEVLTHTDPPLRDAIELFNPTAQAVDLGGWFLTDNRAQPQRWRIPDGTALPANGYLVFYEGHYVGTNLVAATHEFGSAFSLSALGEEVYLFSPTLSYSHGFEFDAAFQGVSFGRHVTSVGEEHFPAQVNRTLGGPNAGPAVGPVVLSEIHYHPAAGGDEFVELYNLSDQEVPLYDPARPANTWKLGGVSFEFAPSNVVLAPRGLLLLVQGDAQAAARFRAQYAVPAQVPVFNFTGVLDNGGETLTLRRPDEPVAGGPEAGTVPYVVVDRVRFDDAPPWPPEADGLGRSLERINPDLYGNDPLNWRASEATHGTPGSGVEPITTPLIATHTRNLAVTTVVGTNPGLEELNVWNAGIGTLYYEVASASPWVTVTPPTGLSTGSGQRNLHYLELATAALPLGTHVLTLEVRDNGSGAPNGPVLVTVTIHVLAPPAPAIGFSPASLLVQTLQGQNAQPAPCAVFNAGTGLLNYSLSSGASWLAVTPAVGSSADAQDARTHAVSFLTSNLPPGAYVSWIAISAPAATEPLAYLPVVAQVLDGRGFTAYNDLSWGAGQLASNVTTHTSATGGGGGDGGGELVDYDTGLPTGAWVSITGGLWVGATHVGQGRAANAGTDAHAVFHGKVDCQGVLSYAETELVLAFSNLNPRALYEVVLFGNRDLYTTRFTTLTLEGAVTFTNRSTPGAVVSGVNGATTRILNGTNTATGLVARYAEIDPGADGGFTLRIPPATNDDGRYYLNAFSLRASSPAPPQVRLDRLAPGWLVLTWQGSNLVLEEAPAVTGPWTARPSQAGAQLLAPEGARQFFRLRPQ